MCEEYIRVIVETGRQQNDDLFVVHAFKEEERGPATSLDRLLARIIAKLERPLRLRTLAGVIAYLNHSVAVVPSSDSSLADAEEELIAAAWQLLHRWAVVVDGAVVEDEPPVAKPR